MVDHHLFSAYKLESRKREVWSKLILDQAQPVSSQPKTAAVAVSRVRTESLHTIGLNESDIR
jgi:hypothetical protein